ncbi:MAG: hypothetical protein KDD27_08705, partial [Saprospiraceae bacterium]|nr:hypothetical protein [Saprospiraceae bacterium]
MSQVYYANDPNGLYQITINGNSCTASFIGQFINTANGGAVGSGDIAICPNGNLYITDNTNTYQVNPSTGATTLVASSSGTPIIVGLVCDENGTLYGAGVNINGGGGGTLYQIDVSAGTTTPIGTLQFSPSGDLVFYNGILYMTSSSGLVQVNVNSPGSSTLLFPGITYVGLTVFAGECNTLLGGDGTNLVTIDLDNGTVSSLCSVAMAGIGGLTTLSEFVPPPQCEVSIDLDGDDSSGAIEADFNAPNFSCASNGGIPIADTDVQIQSSNPIGQMVINISSGLLDPPNEVLILNSAMGIQIAGSGTSSITLTNQGGAALADFTAALEAILYVNQSTVPSPGPREVTVSFNTITGETSNTATAYIQVVQGSAIAVNLGDDPSICPGETVVLNAGVPNATYNWSNFETTQTVTMGTPGTYSVTVNDGINCPGADTVIVSLLPSFIASLVGSAGICEGETATLQFTTNSSAPVNLYVSDNLGGSHNFPNVLNGFTFLVNPVATTDFQLDSVVNAINSACFNLIGQNLTIEVFPVYDFSTAASICEGESILLGGALQTMPGTYIDFFNTANGCDSIVATTLSVFPVDTVYFFETTCTASSAGIFTENYQNQFGCDSIVITETTYIAPETIYEVGTTCNPGEAGTESVLYQNQFGCDSIVITTVVLLLSDTVYLNGISCDPNQVGIFEEIFQNQNGCDSLVITNVAFAEADTTVLFGSSCDPNLTGVFEQTFQNQNGCDSLVITNVAFAEAD